MEKSIDQFKPPSDHVECIHEAAPRTLKTRRTDIPDGIDVVSTASKRPRVEVVEGVQHKSNRCINDAARTFERGRVLKTIPSHIPYLPVTCSDGSRLYLRLKDTKTEEEDNASQRTCKTNIIGYWEEIKMEARMLVDQFSQLLKTTIENENVCNTEGIQENVEKVSDKLWAEKYRPKSFLELLSTEAINGGLLHWIKLWDKSVFGRDYLGKIRAVRQKYSMLEEMEKERDKKFHRKSYLPPNEEYDEKNMPVMKIALLSGDPGLGKTTLAHVVAKHAGYMVKELNASDDRSKEVFARALKDAGNRTECFLDGKPTCLILDEIDGAPVESVRTLIDFALWNITEKGKKAKTGLKRPVICICNDLYAPCLRDLKKHAYVIQFPPIPVSRLLDRLDEISSKENLNIDLHILQALCQKSDCDVRSCLSTLQFLKRGLCSEEEALDVVGVRDLNKGIFTVWNEIFTRPYGNQYRSNPANLSNRFWNILNLTQSHGQYDKLFRGVFENYLRKKQELRFQSVLEVLDWTRWFETLHDFTRRSQNYAIYGLFPMFFVAVHFSLANHGTVRLQFPSVEINHPNLRFQHVAKLQIGKTEPSIARFLDPITLMTDIYPAMLRIIQPCTIRSINPHFWTRQERETFQNVVKLMLTYKMNYVQLKTPDSDAYTFALDPDLEEVVRFCKLDSSLNEKPFSETIKHLVFKEVEAEKMRKNEFLPDVMEKASKKVKRASKSVHRDFFGRPIPPGPENSQDCASKKSTSAVYFRYKEGHCNAVRRYVKMKNL